MRGLAFCSTAYAGMHLYPVLDSTPPAHAVALLYADEALLAKTGANRVGRQARRSEKMRRKVIEAGAVAGLGHVIGRGDEELTRAAVGAVAEIACDNRGALEVVGDDRIVGALLEGDGEGEGVLKAWRKVLGFEEVRRVLKEGGICGRVCGERGDEVLKVLREGGIC